eukprot:CAMPEP_0197238186 /NCGR_PEP_ID=MMETSP1429-20130617/4748_1 /TAXON_ID=49237 /ORGANISM="Chaetoceros  sp., Strain UNC1202" /LENGTH=58 /DNA_ID=CAMNT_0042697291 /DNA_START=319 /DNA_END=495 /DNA_ORIENTATION=-
MKDRTRQGCSAVAAKHTEDCVEPNENASLSCTNREEIGKDDDGANPDDDMDVFLLEMY